MSAVYRWRHAKRSTRKRIAEGFRGSGWSAPSSNENAATFSLSIGNERESFTVELSREDALRVVRHWLDKLPEAQP